MPKKIECLLELNVLSYKDPDSFEPDKTREIDFDFYVSNNEIDFKKLLDNSKEFVKYFEDLLYYFMNHQDFLRYVEDFYEDYSDEFYKHEIFIQSIVIKNSDKTYRFYVEEILGYPGEIYIDDEGINLL